MLRRTSPARAPSPVLIYLFGRSLPKERFVSTVSMFFTMANTAKLIPYFSLHLFSADVLWLCLALVPLAPLGYGSVCA